MKLITLAALSMGLAVAGTANAATNLVTNGSFESVGGTQSHEFGASYSKYGNDVTGWTSASTNAYNIVFMPGDGNSDVTGPNNADTRFSAAGQYLWALPGNADPDGGNFLALDGAPQASGAVTQTVSGLAAGGKYALTFYWATDQLASRSGATTDWITASLGGSSITSGPVSDASQSATDWVKVTETFTATSSSEVLSFLASGTPGNLPPVVLLDGVSLTAVPEPATWALMLVGFGAVGYGLRRRRAAVTA